MTILVTGGAGFIGSNFVLDWLKDCDEAVVNLDNLTYPRIRQYDAVFLNWITPEYAAQARQWVHAAAREADRKPPPVLGYVRTAVGPDAAQRLRKDEAFYRDYHDGYRKHFERLGAELGTVGVASESPYAAHAELARYDALDVVVVRALASATVGAMTALAEAVAPGGTEARTT